MTELPVSIIIDNYNYGRFLREAVDSALSQTYAHTEVIVVDDGSTDDSREIIATYGDRVIPVLKANGGQGSAFNAGFKVSRGQIVLFLDADDFLYPNAVEQVAGAYEACFVKLQFRLRLGDKHSKPLPYTDPRADKDMPNGDVSHELLSRGTYTTPPTSGNAFSRWYLEKILPMPEEPYRQGADGGYLNLLAPLYGDIRSVDQELGMYRHHGDNFYTRTPSSLGDEWFLFRAVREINKEALLREKAIVLGFKLDKGLMLENFQVHALRLSSLRLNPEEYPVPEDTRFGLFTKGLTAEWRYTSDRFGEKILVSLWLVGAAWLPLPAAREVIAWRFDADTRPKVIGNLVRNVRKLLPRSHG